MQQSRAERDSRTRRILRTWAHLALCFSVIPCAQASGDSGIAGKSVFLDPGHSGISDSSLTKQIPNGRGGMKDCQTTGTGTDSGYAEHAFNWEIVQLIRGKLEGLGVRTALSRTDDASTGPCVDQRAAEANSMRPDAIVSVHADGGPRWGSGFHVNYSLPPLNDAQRGPSVQLASTMRDALRDSGLSPSDYIGEEGLYGRADLAGLNFAEYPAVLVELGNMRNQQDSARITSPSGRELYAQAVTNGIVAFLQQTALQNAPSP